MKNALFFVFAFSKKTTCLDGKGKLQFWTYDFSRRNEFWNFWVKSLANCFLVFEKRCSFHMLESWMCSVDKGNKTLNRNSFSSNFVLSIHSWLYRGDDIEVEKALKKIRFPSLVKLDLSENKLADISTFASLAGLKRLVQFLFFYFSKFFI